MRFLHTSDWHLGRTLLGRSRLDEFGDFLDWLANEIAEREIDALLIAGDIFDTTAPSAAAQRLYYRFLHRLALDGRCRHVVAIGGNHDSAQLLDAPRELLRVLRVHVVGGVERVGDAQEINHDREVLLLDDADGRVKAIVAAVPFLRERDISWAEAADSSTTKEKRLVEAISRHYFEVGRRAEIERDRVERETGRRVPIIGMGHLFADIGGPTGTVGAEGAEMPDPNNTAVYGEDVRELYIGTLGVVDATMFPDCFDYTALGHIHLANRVGGRDDLRYSGAPLAMRFGETGQKYVLAIDFPENFENATAPRNGNRDRVIEKIPVPTFLKLLTVRGDLLYVRRQIEEAVAEYKKDGRPVRIDVQLTEPVDPFLFGKDSASWTAGTGIEVVNFSIPRPTGASVRRETIDLTTLGWEEVFELRLEKANVAEEKRESLRLLYKEILLDLDP